jgi:hypothetical protein
VELIALGSRLDPAMISSTPAAKSGGVFTAWERAEEYGFIGSDGARPNRGRHFATLEKE